MLEVLAFSDLLMSVALARMEIIFVFCFLIVALKLVLSCKCLFGETMFSALS